MTRLRTILAASIAAPALVAALAAGAHCDVVDKGSFKLFLKDRALGAETFEIVDAQDSMIVRSRQFLTVPTADGDLPLEKGADILVSREDFSLRQYQSTLKFRGATITRALVIADTHYVAYREGAGLGDAESRVLPPGRLFVMDSQLITLLDLLCRSLHGSSWETRPIHLLALGPRDTLLDARAFSLGTETIRWGSKPVVAHKLQLVADSHTTFTLWTSPLGQLLRLGEPVTGLRVERDPPEVKRRPPPPKTGG
jgi:hypothetical protein